MQTLTRIHDSLGSRPDGDGFLEILLTGLGDPSDLGSESLDVVLFLLQSGSRDEHGEVAVLDANLLDLGVEPVWKQGERKRDKVQRASTLTENSDASSSLWMCCQTVYDQGFRM